MKKNVVMTLAAAALVGAIGVGSTFAYLTASTNTVTNTFAVGNITFGDDDLDDGIRESKVTRDEATNTYADADGVDKYTETAGNAYDHIVSGETVLKDPTIFIKKDSVDCYLFAQVNYNTDQVASFTMNSNWTKVDSLSTTGSDVYVYNNVVKESTSNQHFNLFTDLTFKDLEDGDELSDVTVKAFAIQTKGFESSTDDEVLELVNFGN